MKKRNKIILWSLAALVGIPAVIMTVYMIVMYEPALKGWEAGVKNSPTRVLIASSGSDFKKAMIKDVIKRLQPDKRFFKVVDLGELKKVKPIKFQAIAILNSAEMWKMDSNVRTFLDKYSKLKKIVLLTTSGNSKWKTKKYKVDTISGASKQKHRPEMIKKLVARLRAILK